MYLQYYYLCEWEDVPPLLTLFFGPARATTAFAEKGTERKADSSFHTNGYLFQFDYTYII